MRFRKLPLLTSLLLRLIFVGLIPNPYLSCQDASSNNKNTAIQNQQEKAIAGGGDEKNTPLYTLYFKKADFMQKVFPTAGKRLVFKFHHFYDSDVPKLTMGVWVGRNKSDFLFKTPQVILNTSNDTLLLGPFFLGDVQVKKSVIRNFLNANNGNYVVFVPELYEENSYKYLRYRLYVSDTTNKKSNLISQSASLELNPSPPKDAESDQ